jgi:Cu+-exporting ATPase
MGAECVHCGEDCGKHPIMWNEKPFCCNGCKTVYQLLNENQLYSYYEIENTPGIKIETEDFGKKFAYLDNEEIQNKIYEFSEGDYRKVTLIIPSIHCSSCIWLLENLNTLNRGITHSRVNFVKKEVAVSFNVHEISLRQVVELLASIHYVPNITLEDTDKKKNKQQNKTILYKIGVAGFAFGNTMLLSFPEYIKGSLGIEARYEIVFGFLNLAFAIPVLFYSGNDYLLSAFKNLRRKIINIDLPIAIGMLAIFMQSSYEIISQSGAGYMDSLCGFVFFLLIGKWYQNQTYQALSFERDYKSYFPVAVTKINNYEEENIPIKDLKEGDRILVHNQELIPTDATLLKGEANIDYSFVTGESRPVRKAIGEMLYAGGRQIGSSIELEVKSKVEQSQLTKLWNQDEKVDEYTNLSKLIDKVSMNFTLVVISISILTAVFWSIVDASVVLKAFASVLIVACPCALALSIPFAYGNTMRLLGKKGFYLKNSEVVEKLTKFDTIVFDKTGTITQTDILTIDYEGEELSSTEFSMLKSLTRNSSHPLSSSIYNKYKEYETVEVKEYRELPSRGLIGQFDDVKLKLGSEEFITGESSIKSDTSSNVFISFNEKTKGVFKIRNKYRDGLEELINTLSKDYELHLLSGDNDTEKQNLKRLFGDDNNLHFNQSPADKMEYIKELKKTGKNVLMIGDGLNDAGALKDANVSISIADNVFHFSPACDAILEASYFKKLINYIRLSKSSLLIVKYSFLISFVYNLVGLSFAVSGQLSPIVAAILMPISSVTVVAFVSLMTSLVAKNKL